METPTTEKIDLEATPTPRPHRNTDRWVLGLAGGLPTLATVLGFLGPMGWPLDLLASFRLQYVVVLLAVGVICLAARRWRLLLVFAIALILNLAVILPLYVYPQGLPTLRPEFFMPGQIAGDENELYKPAPPNAPLKLVNLYTAVPPENLENLLELIRKLDADLVLAQGVDPPTLEQMEYRVAPFRVEASAARDDGYGLALLARISMRPKVRAKPVEIVQLVSGERLRLAMVDATIKWGDRQVKLLGVHLPWPINADLARVHQEHVRAIGEWVQKQTDPVVLLGDLGVTPWTYRFRQLQTRTGLVSTQPGFGVAASWPATGGIPLGQIPIDHCLADSRLVTVARFLGPSMGSDHRPLAVHLQWEDRLHAPPPPPVAEPDASQPADGQPAAPAPTDPPAAPEPAPAAVPAS